MWIVLAQTENYASLFLCNDVGLLEILYKGEIHEAAYGFCLAFDMLFLSCVAVCIIDVCEDDVAAVDNVVAHEPDLLRLVLGLCA